MLLKKTCSCSRLYSNLDYRRVHLKIGTCVFYYIKFQKNEAKTTESQHFSEKNIEKVWDIEKFCNIDKFRKGKNDIVPTFFYVKFLDGHASDLILMNQRKNSRTVLTLVQLRLSHHPRKKRKKLTFLSILVTRPCAFGLFKARAKMRAQKKICEKAKIY